MVYAVDDANNLISFASTTPSALSATVAITGLQPGESVLGVDFRPKDGSLFAVTTSRVYTLNKMTGAATQVGALDLATPITGLDIGLDFNPVVDRIRVHGGSAQNLRLHPDTGALVLADTPLTFLAGDANDGKTPTVSATAYTNSVKSVPTATKLFAIDATLDVLVEVTNPNGGLCKTTGALGIDAAAVAGFDIFGGTGGGGDAGTPVVTLPLEAYAALTTSVSTYGGSSSGSIDPSSTGGSYTVYQTGFYGIDLDTGKATLVGNIGYYAAPLRGIAVDPAQ